MIYKKSILMINYSSNEDVQLMLYDTSSTTQNLAGALHWLLTQLIVINTIKFNVEVKVAGKT